MSDPRTTPAVRPAPALPDRTKARPPQWIAAAAAAADPVPARIYNCALGGMHHFVVDRNLWARIEALYPPARAAARANREVLMRVTEWLIACGIEQFLDIGAGIPELAATHDTVRGLGASARVVYVDIDPVAVEYARQLLTGDPRAGAVRGDLRDPHHITDELTAEVLDFAEPVGVVLGGVLQFLPDDDVAARSISRLTDALCPGSCLVITHWTPDPDPHARARQDAAYQLYRETPTPAVTRTADQLAHLIDPRWTLLPPGIVTADRWQPDPDDPHDDPDQHPPTVLVAAAHLRPPTPAGNRTPADDAMTPDATDPAAVTEPSRNHIESPA